MIRVDVRGVDAVIKRLQEKRKSLEQRLHLLIERLGENGIQVADARFASVPYDGERDVQPGVIEWVNDTHAIVSVSGQTVLFLEFGAGLFAGTHPMGPALGYGPGTWSEGPNGKGHWDDPNGWYYAHKQKSYGNGAYRIMYDTAKDMRNQVTMIAREVFG